MVIGFVPGMFYQIVYFMIPLEFWAYILPSRLWFEMAGVSFTMSSIAMEVPKTNGFHIQQER